MAYIRHGYIRLIILDEGKKEKLKKKVKFDPENGSSRTSLSGGWVSSNYCTWYEIVVTRGKKKNSWRKYKEKLKKKKERMMQVTPRTRL